MAMIKRVAPLLISAFMLVISSYLAYSRLGTSPKVSVASASSSDRPVAATSTVDAALAAEIDRAINQSDVKQARWGVFAMSLQDGRVVYARNADELFTPASNMKVFTTAVALDLMGADSRWRTSVYADKEPAGGIVNGDLVLYGRGAPDLISGHKGGVPSLADLAEQLYQRGIREVRGSVVGDSSYFRGEPYGLGWQWNDLQWYYGAEPSALTVDSNAVNVVIAPGSKSGESAIVKAERGGDYLNVINKTTTGDRSAFTTIGVQREISANEVHVWGEFPVGGRSFGAFLSVHNPGLWAATLFKQALVARGIRIAGEPRSRDSRVVESDKFDPAKAVELANVDSETLGKAVRETNKESNNLYAELILRTLGKEKGSAIADDDPRRKAQRGDDEAGITLINSWLKDHNIDSNTLALRDGSGLSRLDLVTPQSTARLLVAIAKTSSATVFHDSLPIAGRDGTLGGRLSDHAGRIVGKTGTIVYVHSLSGYAETPKGDVLAFSIFCNDAVGQGNPVRVIDRIASLIADYGQPAKEK